MVTPAAGSVVLVPFPFSDLSGTRLRPAVVLCPGGRGDWVLCQVTSNPYGDPLAVQIAAGDFSRGALHQASYARPAKLFTANLALISGEAGILRAEKLREIIDILVGLLQASVPA